MIMNQLSNVCIQSSRGGVTNSPYFIRQLILARIFEYSLCICLMPFTFNPASVLQCQVHWYYWLRRNSSNYNWMNLLGNAYVLCQHGGNMAAPVRSMSNPSGITCNTTSFQKKSRSKLVSIPGTRPSVQNGQLIVSTGVTSLDYVIGQFTRKAVGLPIQRYL